MVVRVIVDGVLGVTVVLIGHDEVLVIYVAIFVVIFCNWRCPLYSGGQQMGDHRSCMKTGTQAPKPTRASRERHGRTCV